MENRISHSIGMPNLTTLSNIAESTIKSLKNRFYEILLVAIFFGSIAYILKTTEVVDSLKKPKLPKRPKENSSKNDEEKAIKDVKATKNEESIRNREVIRSEKTDPNSKELNTVKQEPTVSDLEQPEEEFSIDKMKKYRSKMELDAIGSTEITKENYKNFVKYIDILPSKSNITKDLKESIYIKKNGDVSFFGHKALSAYSKAIVSSGCDNNNHPLKWYHPNHLIYLELDNPKFETLKKMGKPVLSEEGSGYVISGLKHQALVEDHAREKYGANAEYAAFTEKELDKFEDKLLEKEGLFLTDIKHTILWNVDSRTYIAFPEGTKAKYNWATIYSARVKKQRKTKTQ